MESILVLTHTDDANTLTKASLEAISAGISLAAQLSAPLTIGVLATDATPAQSLAPTSARLLVVFGEAFAQPRYASDAAACEALCRAAATTIVLAPASSRFARVAAGVAHRLGGLIDTHITAVVTATTLGAPGSDSGTWESNKARQAGDPIIEVTRWFYRQRIEADLTREARPWFLLLDPGTHPAFAAEPSAKQTPVEQIQVELPILRTSVTGLREPSHDQQTIRPDAKLLFVAGAGWTKKQPDGHAHTGEAADLILGFLHSTSASLGSSKSLVDQGGDNQPVLPFLTHLNQVGQTGATPRHAKGLSTCCHGEEPHVVGWRFISSRRAISLDPNCGWTRGKADVVYIADAFQVMTKVNALLAPDKN
jgi:electron transfer flavoprotein alpha subunit